MKTLKFLIPVLIILFIFVAFAYTSFERKISLLEDSIRTKDSIIAYFNSNINENGIFVKNSTNSPVILKVLYSYDSITDGNSEQITIAAYQTEYLYQNLLKKCNNSLDPTLNFSIVNPRSSEVHLNPGSNPISNTDSDGRDTNYSAILTEYKAPINICNSDAKNSDYIKGTKALYTVVME